MSLKQFLLRGYSCPSAPLHHSLAGLIEKKEVYSADVCLHLAFWSEVTEDKVYPPALQRVTQRGPRDVVSPKLVYEPVPSFVFPFFFLILF